MIRKVNANGNEDDDQEAMMSCGPMMDENVMIKFKVEVEVVMKQYARV